MKKSTFLLSILFFSAFLIFPSSTKAFEALANDSIFVPENEVVEGTLYAVGANITVNGDVTGDVICAGQSVNINGKVDGDVICAGQSVNINGSVGGSTRVAGNSISINGSVARNVNAFGATINLGPGASVGWDMLIGAGKAELLGNINGDLHGSAANATIAGKVGRNIKLTLNDGIKDEKGFISFSDKSDDEKPSLNIFKTAVIGGTIAYTAKQEISVEDGALITGEITHNLPKVKSGKKEIAFFWSFSKLYSIFGSLVIGLVLISFWREKIKIMTDQMLTKPGPTIGWGIVVMFLTPIIAILLAITLIGMPLSAVLLLAWAIALWLSKIFVGILVGRKVLEKLNIKKDSLAWAMVVGIVIVQIIFSFPVVGWILGLVAVWWGLGGLFLQFKNS